MKCCDAGYFLGMIWRFNESKQSFHNSHQKHKDNRVSETFFSASA